MKEMRHFSIKQTLATLVALLCSVAANAYDFEVDGIYYNILSAADLTVEVTSGDKGYSGEVVIPTTVTYKSKTLTVKSIGFHAFYFSKELTSLIIGDSITHIGMEAFSNTCVNLRSVKIGAGLTAIERGTFMGCSGLTDITIPNNVKSIGSEAFRDCSSLTSIVIPSTLEHLSNNVFRNCKSLKKLRIEDGETPLKMEYSREDLYYGYGNNMFYGAPLESIYLGRNIENYLPNSTVSYVSPFLGISDLKLLVIGERVSNIEKESFINCSKLESIYLMCTTPPTISGDNFSEVNYANVTIYVPQGTLAAYQAADVWKGFWDIQEHEGSVDFDVEVEKCATPTIGYADGKLTFTSETEGAEFVTEITNSDITKHYGSTIELTVAYNVSTYAKRDGYANSDVATVTLCWIEGANGSDIMEIESVPVMIKAYDGTVIINGVMTDTEVAVYSTNGTKLGSATTDGGEVAITTSLGKGNTAIVHIGNKAVKVIMQ